MSSPSHAGPEESIVLRVVGEKGADPVLRRRRLESRVIAQTRNCKFSGLDKVHADVGLERLSPLLRGPLEDDNVELQVGPEIVADILTAGGRKEFASLGNFRLGDGSVAGEFRLPQDRIGGQLGSREGRHGGQQPERKVGLGLLEIEESTERTEIDGGSQEFGDIAKRDASQGSYLRHLVAALLQPRSLLLLVEVGNEVALEEDVIVAGTGCKKLRKKVNLFVKIIKR